MVYFMENPIKMDDFGGKPPIFGSTPILTLPGHDHALTASNEGAPFARP